MQAADAPKLAALLSLSDATWHAPLIPELTHMAGSRAVEVRGRIVFARPSSTRSGRSHRDPGAPAAITGGHAGASATHTAVAVDTGVP